MKAIPTLVSDIKDIVVNGDFSAWTNDNPNNWAVAGEVGDDPMVNEVGEGEGHGGAGTGYCNIYTSDGTLIYIYQIIAVVQGKRYIVSIDVNLVAAGGLKVTEGGAAFADKEYTTTGVKTFEFTANDNSITLNVYRKFGVGECDVTFKDIIIKPARQRVSI